jgi:hypothetical protein
MKKLATISVLISITTLLSGCSLFGNNYETEKEEVVQEDVSPDSLLDDRLFASAVNNTDMDECEKITDETKKGECKKVVEADGITVEAVAELSDSSCSKIELDRYEEECENQVAEAKKKENKFEYFEEQNKLAVEMYENDDLEGCEKIELENYKKQCRDNILLNRALESKDETQCEQLDTEEAIEDCKLLILE